MLFSLVVASWLNSAIPAAPPPHWDAEDQGVAASVVIPCINHFLQFDGSRLALRNPWAQNPARGEPNIRVRPRSDGTTYGAELYSSDNRGTASVTCVLTMPGADPAGAVAYVSALNIPDHTRRQQGNDTLYFEGPAGADAAPSVRLRVTERNGAVVITMSGSKPVW